MANRKTKKPRYMECSHCSNRGHELKDCAKPDEFGFMTGCPLCNKKTHLYEECRRRNNNLDEEYDVLVTQRANHPPLRNMRLDWLQLWIDKGCPVDSLPWTVEFSKRVHSDPEGTIPGCDLRKFA